MSHANAPLTPAGRLRLIERCQDRPVAHVAAEAGISRACLSKWKARFESEGRPGVEDRSSAPFVRPTQTPPAVVELIETWRRDKKWTARQIQRELTSRGHEISVATVGRWFVRLGINRRRDLDPTGECNRHTGKIVARFAGHMVHLDVKKVGRIPDGGGWRAHGRGSDQDKAAQRAKDTAARKARKNGTKSPRGGYVYLHSIVDGYSRLAYTEHLGDETAKTTIGFYHRARAFFAAHGIDRVVRVVTDNGANYRAKDFVRAVLGSASRHQRTRPYTPRHNGKVERYQRILAEEVLYAREWSSEDERAAAIKVWNIHYNYHRAHTAAGDKPPASRLRRHVTNVMNQNT
ncbi:IS481 family transposase [Luteimicrobium sp. DT211]|uniref:IS481 family transposase n=1 Tax=Luteimicrobium sp. DT211 TaxID=3393412 RepID=UPI003CEEE4CF